MALSFEWTGFHSNIIKILLSLSLCKDKKFKVIIEIKSPLIIFYIYRGSFIYEFLDRCRTNYLGNQTPKVLHKGFPLPIAALLYIYH
jgi:hypothetical protein